MTAASSSTTISAAAKSPVFRIRRRRTAVGTQNEFASWLHELDYFIYITNDWESTPAEIVFGANDRCNQENVWAQLKEARAFHAPLNTLLSNCAYILIAAQAWNLRAWLALSLPPPKGRQREKQKQEQQ